MGGATATQRRRPSSPSRHNPAWNTNARRRLDFSEEAPVNPEGGLTYQESATDAARTNQRRPDTPPAAGRNRQGLRLVIGPDRGRFEPILPQDPVGTPRRHDQ